MELRHAVQALRRTSRAHAPSSRLACQSSPWWWATATPFTTLHRPFSTSHRVLDAPPRSSSPTPSKLGRVFQKAGGDDTAAGATLPSSTTTPSIALPGRAPSRPPLPQSWAEKLRAKTNPIPRPGTSSRKPDPATSGDPTDFARLINWDASEFLSQGHSNLEKLRLRSTTGRTVKVGGNVDLTRAFALLQSTLRQNAVRTDARRQRFHERPGLKRKRLNSERWRKRFKDGFHAALRRTRELHAQGW